MIEIDEKIKNIIKNEYNFKRVIESQIEQFNTDINVEIDRIKTAKVSGEQLQALINDNMDQTAKELFNWINVNFINLIDNLSKELRQEIGNRNGDIIQDAPGYNDPMYDKIKASMENDLPPAIALFENDNVDKAPLDGLLQNLAKFSEDRKVEFPITLFIRGAVVSGMLIGHTAFFELLERVIRCMTSNTLEGEVQIKMLADAIKKASDESRSKLEELSPEARDARILKTRYIYIKQAEIVCSNGPIIPIGTEGLLRIRTNSIDSFSIGAIRSQRTKHMAGTNHTHAPDIKPH